MIVIMMICDNIMMIVMIFIMMICDDSYHDDCDDCDDMIVMVVIMMIISVDRSKCIYTMYLI